MEPFIHQAFYNVLVFSLVPMAAIAVSGGIVSLVQAITQIQEQALVHLVRFLTVVALLMWFGEWAFHDLERLFVAIVRADHRSFIQ